MRPIDADELKLKLPNTYRNGFENCRECRLLEREEVNAYIDRMPTVDAAPVKHGKWEEPEPEGIISYNRGSYAQCSVCKKKSYFGRTDKYCRYCGAKMDLEE